jgi:Xaa-Pro dipeptidase
MLQKERLIYAENIAKNLFIEIESRNLIQSGKTEMELNQEIFALAKSAFNIDTFWHKRIVRSGINTLAPYNDNPPDLLILEDDILFMDLGPVLETWEADIGRTYTIGNDKKKYKMVQDIEHAWWLGKEYYESHWDITGAEYYKYIESLAHQMGYLFEAEMTGHLIGSFPHSKIHGKEKENYVHLENNQRMRDPDKNGNPRDWILEIHFIDPEKRYGGFFEQLLT